MGTQNTSNARNPLMSNQATLIRTGIVLPQKHPNDPTLYYVSFGERTTNPDGLLDSGVWCANGIQPYIRYRDANNNAITYGSYIPIQPYTPVNVLMANGGIGLSTIIGFPPTPTSVPDMENRDNLHVLGQTPRGNAIELDDKVGAIRIIQNKGASMISMADELIALDITQGAGGSAKETNTNITMRKGGIYLNLPNSRLQFDETGLSISFDDDGTKVRITKKGVSFEGCETFKVHSDEQVTLKGNKMTLQGTKDASLTASELKVGGKQLTTISGAQINMESIFAITLKSLAINFLAWSKIQEVTPLKDATILGMDVKTAPIITNQTPSFNITSGVTAIASGLVALDFNVFTNTGMAMSIAPPTCASCKATCVACHAALTALGTTMLLKTAPIVSTNKILADTIAGTSEPAQGKGGGTEGAKDKNDKKSYSSVAATKFNSNNYNMEKYSVAPNQLEAASKRQINPSQDSVNKSYLDNDPLTNLIRENSKMLGVNLNTPNTRTTTLNRISKYKRK